MVEKNTTTTDCILAKIDNTLRICKCRLWGNRNDSINPMSECSKLTQKEYRTRNNRMEKSDQKGTVQEIEIWPYYERVYAQTRIRPREWDV